MTTGESSLQSLAEKGCFENDNHYTEQTWIYSKMQRAAVRQSEKEWDQREMRV